MDPNTTLTEPPADDTPRWIGEGPGRGIDQVLDSKDCTCGRTLSGINIARYTDKTVSNDGTFVRHVPLPYPFRLDLKHQDGGACSWHFQGRLRGLGRWDRNGAGA